MQNRSRLQQVACYSQFHCCVQSRIFQTCFTGWLRFRSMSPTSSDEICDTITWITVSEPEQQFWTTKETIVCFSPMLFSKKMPQMAAIIVLQWQSIFPHKKRFGKLQVVNCKEGKKEENSFSTVKLLLTTCFPSIISVGSDARFLRRYLCSWASRQWPPPAPPQ